MRGASRDALARGLASLEQSAAAQRGTGETGGEGGTGGATGTQDVSEGLYAVASLLDREPSLRRALTDPASTPDSRRGLVEAVLGGQLPPLPLGVFADLAADRWNTADDLRHGVEVLAATAAMTQAEAEGVLDEVEDELFRFGRLLDREPSLRAALTDPGLPAERKTALLEDLLGSRAQPTTLRLVGIAVTRPRTGSLEHALEELSELAAQRRQRYVAQVRVARPLDADQQERLVTSLARIYGRQVQLHVDVDPSVLGGVEVRVGDEVLNGTVSRRLADVHRRLSA